jgi:hypothetical protein
MPYVAQIVGLFQTPQFHTIHDSQYLVSYDQGTGNIDWSIISDADINKAQRYADSASIDALRYAVPPDYPWRNQYMSPQPNAPLWRYTLNAVSVPS